MVEDVAEPLDRDPDLLELLPELRHADHRARDALREHVERDQPADRQVVRDHRLRAEIQDRRHVELGDQLDRIVAGVAEIDHALVGGGIAREAAFPRVLPLRLDRGGLDGLDPGDALDQQCVIGRTALELLVEPAAQRAGHQQRDRQIGGDREHRDEEQLDRIQRHHREEDDREHRIDQHRQRGVGEEFADRLELADAHRGVADAARFEIAQRQPQQVAEQPRAQLDVDLLARFGIEPRAQPAERGLPERHRDEADRQHRQRR